MSCLICDADVVTKGPKSKKKVPRSIVLGLCRALTIPQKNFGPRLLNAPFCPPCLKKARNIKSILCVLETLQSTLKQFRLGTLNALENSIGKEATSIADTAKNLLRKEIIELLTPWKKSYTEKVEENGKSSKTIFPIVALEQLSDEKIRRYTTSNKSSEVDHEYGHDSNPESEDGTYYVKDEEMDISDQETNNDPEWTPADHTTVEEVENKSDVESGKDDEEVDDIKNEKIPCILCRSSFRCQFDLDVHTKKIHLGVKRPFECNAEGCDRTFRQRYSWRAHVKSHEIGDAALKIHTCEICDKAYESKNSLERHKSSIHTGTWKYPCPKCPSGFHRPSDLKVHIGNEHEDNLPFPCDYCQQKFSSSRRRHVHVSSAHPEQQGKETTACSICTKVFSCGDALRCHKLSVHKIGKADYTCDICSKSFARKSWLDRHSLGHSKEKTFSCDECDESFRFPNSLAAHKMKHAQIYPHVCSICGKKFRLRTPYNTHMAIHDNDKSSTCEICGKSFSLKVYLDLHRKRIHYKEVGAKPPVYRKKPKKPKPSVEEKNKIKNRGQVLQLGTVKLEKGDGQHEYIELYVANE